MGYGIALVCAQHGFPVKLFDINESSLLKAKEEIAKQLGILLSKEKISLEILNETASKIIYTKEITACSGDLVIEAIAEEQSLKVELFRNLLKVNEVSTIYATNTSSLSVDAIMAEAGINEQYCGLHFFNPAFLMKLVEVVKGKNTSENVIKEISDFSKKIGKVPVVCIDSPGFIVNRVARHFYLEALHQVEQHVVTIENADVLLESCGFKMGPFRLMDLIGNDVNLAVSRSLYEACGKPARFKPSPLQEQKVKEGALGRKTKKGFYTY